MEHSLRGIQRDTERLRKSDRMKGIQSMRIDRSIDTYDSISNSLNIIATLT